MFADEGSRGYVVSTLREGGLGGNLGGVTWPMVRAAFLSRWLPYYGRPQLIRLDPADAFRAIEFKKNMESFGLNVDRQPGEAHWRMGICERLIQLHKTTCGGLGRAHPDMTFSELHDMGAWCHNHSYNHKGFTPGQLLGGATPEGLEPDPLADDPHMARLVNSTGEAMELILARQRTGKECHRKALASDRLRRAAHARTRSLTVFPPGMTI